MGADSLDVIELVMLIEDEFEIDIDNQVSSRILTVQDGINHLIDELVKGNPNPGIGNKPLGNGLTEYRHKKGVRVVTRKRGTVIEILGKSGKDKTNQDFVINRVKRNLKQRLYD